MWWWGCIPAGLVRFFDGPICPEYANPCENGLAVKNPEEHPDLVRDCKTLLALRDALGGDYRLDWTGDKPIESWQGIIVNDSQVTGMRLVRTSRNRMGILTGEIPPELGELTALRELNMHGARLTGSIPPELGQLTKLERLQIGHNSLMGPIPPQLGQLANLWLLDLSENNLVGPIPPELGQLASLRGLDLSRNELTGSIPPDLGDLGELRRLELGANRLTGRIPPELGQLNLRWLFLDANELTGSIPPELAQLTELETLGLSGNKLTGSIPLEFAQLTKLRDFYFGGQGIEECLPAELSRISSMTNVPMCATAIEGLDVSPLVTDLAPNYPNPFNEGTRITYSLSEGGPVQIAIYSLLGQRIRTLVDEVQSPGFYHVAWNGRDNRGRPLASGNYLFRLTTSEDILARKLTILR